MSDLLDRRNLAQTGNVDELIERLVEADSQTDLDADRQVANTLAELIIGGSLTSFEITGTARETG